MSTFDTMETLWPSQTPSKIYQEDNMTRPCPCQLLLFSSDLRRTVESSVNHGKGSAGAGAGRLDSFTSIWKLNFICRRGGAISRSRASLETKCPARERRLTLEGRVWRTVTAPWRPWTAATLTTVRSSPASFPSSGRIPARSREAAGMTPAWKPREEYSGVLPRSVSHEHF